MLDEILPRILSSQWRVIIIVSAVLLLATEVGFRIGLGLFRAKDEARKAQIGGVQNATLGVLGLLLGFTFAMALGLYENRRDLVQREANSIATTFLRAAFLPATHQATVENLLRRYVVVRLNFYKSGDEAARAAAELSAAEIQRELWTHAVQAGKESPSPIVATFITSLNETIDFDATQLHAFRTRVPGSVWILVLAVAIVGCCATGYRAGSSGARAGFSDVALPLLLAIVITLVVDLAHPQGGLILIDQRPLLDLQNSLATGARPSPGAASHEIGPD
jgi:hypothetical protein